MEYFPRPHAHEKSGCPQEAGTCKQMVRTAKEGMMNNASSSEVYGKMQEVFIKMDDKGSEGSAHKELKDFKDAVITEGMGQEGLRYLTLKSIWKLTCLYG
ncbi:hypothetical protein ZWY2020_058519 [Hordeum vulgare]|nr:hypothetical protein ZWY2020_058519 [Hordeum vulgare]